MTLAALTALTTPSAVTTVTPVTAVAPTGSAAADIGAAAGAAAPARAGRSGARAAGEFARALDRAGAARAGVLRAGASLEHAGVDPARVAGKDRPAADDRARDAGDTAVAATPLPVGTDINTDPPTDVGTDAGIAARLLTELHALRTPAPADAAAAATVATAGTASKPTLRTPPMQGTGRGPELDTAAAAAATTTTAIDAQAQETTQSPAKAQAQAQETTQTPAKAQAQPQTQAPAPAPAPAPTTTLSTSTSTPGLAEVLPAAAIEFAATRLDAGSPSLVSPAPLPALPNTALTAGATATAEARLTAAPGSADFAHQLGAQVTTFVRDGVEHARLHLNPAELGPVTVRIRVDGDAAQVHLAVEHPLTRQALEQSMPLLAGSLREAGLTLSGGGVFEQPRQPGDGAPQSARGPAGDRRQGDADPEPALHTVAVRSRRRGVVDLVA